MENNIKTQRATRKEWKEKEEKFNETTEEIQYLNKKIVTSPDKMKISEKIFKLIDTLFETSKI